MDWEAIIKFLISVTSSAGLLMFLGKKVIEAFIAERVENYKSNLEKSLLSIPYALRNYISRERKP